MAEAPEEGKIEAVYRAESRGVFAALVRILGDFDLAEEALQDALLAAVVQWPRDGVPANPRAWLISAGRFKAIDALRRRVRADRTARELGQHLESQLPAPDDGAGGEGVRHGGAHDCEAHRASQAENPGCAHPV